MSSHEPLFAPTERVTYGLSADPLADIRAVGAELRKRVAAAPDVAEAFAPALAGLFHAAATSPVPGALQAVVDEGLLPTGEDTTCFLVEAAFLTAHPVQETALALAAKAFGRAA